MNILITSKTDRIIEFIGNLRKLDQDVTELAKDISNIQQRWGVDHIKNYGFYIKFFFQRNFSKWENKGSFNGAITFSLWK